MGWPLDKQVALFFGNIRDDKNLHVLLPALRKSADASVIFTSSSVGRRGRPNWGAYAVSKFATEGLSQVLASEVQGNSAIRVNTIVPGNVQTPRQMKWYTPEGEAEIVAAQCLDGRIQPSDVAAMALFLASDDSRYCTAHNYWVDAGWR